jgi:hypothetical protein
MHCLYWHSLLVKPSVTATRDSHVTLPSLIALATLGGMTKNRNDPIVPPKVAKAIKEGNVT